MTIQKFSHASNHLFKYKHPTKQNPNIWSSLGKLSYGGLFISIKLFISEIPQLTGFFKGSQNNKKGCKVYFSATFLWMSTLWDRKVCNTSVLVVSKMLDAFKKILKHNVLYDSRSIYHRQSTNIPPTFKSHRIDRVSTTILAKYLTIIPRARMGSESIAHEAKDRMGYCLGYCFSKIQLVGQKYWE